MWAVCVEIYKLVVRGTTALKSWKHKTDSTDSQCAVTLIHKTTEFKLFPEVFPKTEFYMCILQNKEHSCKLNWTCHVLQAQ